MYVYVCVSKYNIKLNLLDAEKRFKVRIKDFAINQKVDVYFKMIC